MNEDGKILVDGFTFQRNMNGFDALFNQVIGY